MKKEILSAIASLEKSLDTLNKCYLKTPLKRISDSIISQELILRELRELLSTLN